MARSSLSDDLLAEILVDTGIHDGPNLLKLAMLLQDLSLGELLLPALEGREVLDPPDDHVAGLGAQPPRPADQQHELIVGMFALPALIGHAHDLLEAPQWHALVALDELD